jgi:hypothetical protein
MSGRPAQHPHTHAASRSHEGTSALRSRAEPRTQLGSYGERAATWLSLACAVHCLLMPVVIGLMPLLGASGVTHLGSTAESILTLLVIVSAVLGVTWGYRRHHDLRIVFATGIGLAAYLVGHVLVGHVFAESWYGIGLAGVGALTLAASSFLSARLSHAAEHACSGASCTH